MLCFWFTVGHSERDAVNASLRQAGVLTYKDRSVEITRRRIVLSHDSLVLYYGARRVVYLLVKIADPIKSPVDYVGVP